MRVMVALENRFLKTADGNIYSSTVCDYNFWKRYLQVFDEVFVFARVQEVDQFKADKPKANGPGVCFIEVPTYIGPWQYLQNQKKLKRLARESIDMADAFILRVPGTMSSLIWQHLKREGRAYGVEVVGDPWDSLAPGSVRGVLRPLIRWKARRDMVAQCQLAIAASYVTEYSLQKRYPPGGWSTHYSSIELSSESVVNNSVIDERLGRIEAKSTKSNKEAWRICHVGMMEHLYKAPDVLIEAVALCVKKKINVELIMIGEGRFRKQLENKAKELGIAGRVEFKGKLTPGQQVYSELDRADLYVLPSRQEGLPRTVIEAMARGLPCIASNVGGIPELLPKEYLVKPNDTEGLAKKIEFIIKNPALLKEIIPHNVKKASEYKQEVLNERRIEFYRQVAKAVNQSC